MAGRLAMASPFISPLSPEIIRRNSNINIKLIFINYIKELKKERISNCKISENHSEFLDDLSLERHIEVNLEE